MNTAHDPLHPEADSHAAGREGGVGIVKYLLHKQVLDSLPEGITIQDRDFNIIFQNIAMQKSFGRHIGEKCYAVYERRDLVCEGCGIEKAFLTGEATMTLRTAFTADGTTSYWENSCFPLFDPAGNIIAGVEVCRNISDRVTLEEEVKQRNIELGQFNRELNRQAHELQAELSRRVAAEESLRKEIEEREQAERKLQRSNDELNVLLRKLEEAQSQMVHAEKMASIGQLAAGIAHEINNPIAFVSSNLATLGEYCGDILALVRRYRDVVNKLNENGQNLQISADLREEIRQVARMEQEMDLDFILTDMRSMIAESRDGADRIKEIVADLKDFVRPGEDEAQLADINQGLDTVLKVIAHGFREGITVIRRYGELPKVMCQPRQLNQAFMNILINAAQAIAGTGEIKIATGLVDDRVEIAISDTGSGMTEEVMARACEPFFTTRGVGRGKGLGLNVAYNIVTQHRGTIDITSKPGKGATFTISIPVQGADEQ